MTNSQIFFKKLLLMSVGVGLMTVLVTTAKADAQVTRNHRFDLQDIDDIEISNSVGRVEIIPVEGDELRVTLDIEAKERGFFRRRADVKDMDLEVRERGDTLFLSFDEEHVSAEWVVEMPRVDYANVAMGVGEVRLEVVDTELNVELGVGDVNIHAPGSTVGRISLNVGVGDASVRGADIIDRETAFISKRIRAEGRGSRDLDVDLGVGDVSIRLE